MERLVQLIAERIAAKKAAAADFAGVSGEELAQLEQRVGLELPAAYRAYLLEMGWSTGHLLEGTDLLFGCLHELTSEGRELMKLHGVSLADDAFVFYAHQGYDYMYFVVSEGIDPPVYRYMEGEGAPVRRFETFSAYVTWMFQQG